MRKRLAILLAFLLMLTCIPTSVHSAEAATDYSWIRVKLSVANATSLSISLKGDYFIDENGASFSGGSLSLRTNGDGTLTVAHSSLGDVYTGSGFSLMREKVDRTAGYASMSVSGVVRKYLGHFTISVTSSGYLQVINKVPLAHYLYGVIRGEMGNAFPLEALKAQAIAAKCYAFNNMSSSRAYDIGDTSSDQVYKGYDSSESNVINAVDSTIDKVLTVNGKILCTYYSASNGGETKLVSQAWSDRGGDAGYAIALDEYDIANTLSLKETAYFPLNGGSMSSALQSFLISKAAASLGTGVASVDMIHGVQAYSPRYNNVTRDLTRATVTMTVTTGSSGFSSGFGSFGGFTGFGTGFGTSFDTGFGSDTSSGFDTGSSNVITGTQTTVTVDFALSELLSGGVFSNSSLRIYWGEAVNGGYNIYHVRYGHGVGLSQRGAQQRASAGHNYQQILAFYYPGASLTSITVAEPQDPVKPVVNTPSAGTDGSTAVVYPAWGMTTGNVNFRKGPSVSYESMGKIATGTQILVYGYDSNWYYIECNGVLGFMSADYVVITGSAGTVTTPTDTPTPSSDVTTGLTVQASGEVTGSSVNFRSGPATTYQSLGKLAKGTELAIYGQVDNWYYVSTNGVYGYISASYVKITNTAVATPTPTPTLTPEVPTINYSIGTVTGSGVNFRSGPATNYQSLGKLAKGTELIIYGQEGTWYHANAGGVDGYISASYVKITTAATATPTPTPEITTQMVTYSLGAVTGSGVNFRDKPETNGSAVLYKLSKGTQLVLWNQSGEWYYAQYGDDYGYIASKYVKVTGTYNATIASTPAPHSSAGSTATGGIAQPIGTGETTGSVNFREGPSTSSRKLAQLKKGTEMTLYALEDGWYEVDVGGVHGYVSAKYVKITGEASGSDATQTMTSATGETTGSVNFRNAASTTSGIIETLKKGTQVAIHYESGDWYCVSYNGTMGYLYRAYVKVISAGSTGIPTGSAPTLSDSTTPTVGTDGSIALGGVVAVTNGEVYFRQSPSKSGVINRELPKGTSLIVYNCLDDWCLVAVDGILGYVHSSYIEY